jgi:hypothetical protein
LERLNARVYSQAQLLDWWHVTWGDKEGFVRGTDVAQVDDD